MGGPDGGVHVVGGADVAGQLGGAAGVFEQGDGIAFELFVGLAPQCRTGDRMLRGQSDSCWCGDVTLLPVSSLRGKITEREPGGAT